MHHVPRQAAPRSVQARAASGGVSSQSFRYQNAYGGANAQPANAGMGWRAPAQAAPADAFTAYRKQQSSGYLDRKAQTSAARHA